MGYRLWGEEGNNESLSDLFFPKLLEDTLTAGESEDTPRYLKQYEEQQRAQELAEAEKPFPILGILLIGLVFYFLMR